MRSIRNIVLAAVFVTVIAGLLSWYSSPDGSSKPYGTEQDFMRPLRLRIVESAGYEEFLLGLRVFHYRPQFQGRAIFEDEFFDTSSWDLKRMGFSFKFRRRIDDDETDYRLRLEQEPDFVGAGQEKIDIVSILQPDLAAAIDSGQWDLAINSATDASESLRKILSDNNIDPSTLMPRLVGNLQRDRYEITDKGRSWFELDLERWKFTLRSDSSPSNVVTYEEFVIDTRLDRQDPELQRRVSTMYRAAEMMHGIVETREAPYQRAVNDLWDDSSQPDVP